MLQRLQRARIVQPMPGAMPDLESEMNKVHVVKQANGSLLLSTIRRGQFVMQKYYGMTERQARSDFAAFCKAI